VSLPLMAAMFRDRAADTGGSAFGARGKEFELNARHGLVPLRGEDARDHDARDFFDDRHHHRIPELTIRLRV
jgi:hypothetical protein